MVFGYIDESRYSGELEWHPVISKEFWDIQLDEILLDGISLGICSPPNKCTMTPDSGTTFMTMPSWALTQFIDKTF